MRSAFYFCIETEVVMFLLLLFGTAKWNCIAFWSLFLFALSFNFLHILTLTLTLARIQQLIPFSIIFFMVFGWRALNYFYTQSLQLY